MPADIPDASGASEDIRIALARVESSLRIVLIAIAKLKAEMNHTTLPDINNTTTTTTWVGTP